jgi:hypothetical protein
MRPVSSDDYELLSHEQIGAFEHPPETMNKIID